MYAEINMYLSAVKVAFLIEVSIKIQAKCVVIYVQKICCTMVKSIVSTKDKSNCEIVPYSFFIK